MATMVHNPITRSQVDYLEVLWALYQSQPKKVKIAFRSMIEAEETAKEFQWQKDLKAIKALKDNWDDEGAPAINRVAIANIGKLMKKVKGNNAASVRLYPTPLGAVMVCLETKNGRIKGELGDKELSYFVKRAGMTTERHSFEPVCSETLLTLANNLESLV